ncbi:hypothetical protein GE061_010168 [Apolygus lucorum]|uniref:Protein quiver n=1 Tax=Apolygus lucorum TaxID=248454 RepID=A0A6A4KED3_APOLU|nr:hypothetical protein GE061_010168 [Apolygus lucorum]
MRNSTGINLAQSVSMMSSYNFAQATVFYILTLLNRAKGKDVSECYNCYSTDTEGCMDPYAGRYAYNSNILIPDCNYDMARNFHSSLMYVLTRDTHEATVTKIDEGYIPKWDGISDVDSFQCCKALFQVTVAEKADRYVVRGCCCNPISYDQCRETSMIIQNLTDLAPKNTTYNLEHCSFCGSDRCNSSYTSSVDGFLATIFILSVLMITFRNGVTF